jgi:MYXO-CTERM domain-containing protein
MKYLSRIVQLGVLGAALAAPTFAQQDNPSSPAPSGTRDTYRTDDRRESGNWGWLGLLGLVGLAGLLRPREDTSRVTSGLPHPR